MSAPVAATLARVLALATLALAGATLILHGIDGRYREIAPVALAAPSPGVSAPPTDHVRRFAAPARHPVQLRWLVHGVGDSPYVAVTARTTSPLAPGAWVVVSRDGDGRPLVYRQRRLVAVAEAAGEGALARAVVPVGGEVRAMEVVLRLPAGETVEILDLRAKAMATRPWFQAAQGLLVGLWATAGLAAAWGALRAAASRWRGAAVLAVAAAILAGGLVPKPLLVRTVATAIEAAPASIAVRAPPDAVFDGAAAARAQAADAVLPHWFGPEKIGHIVLFAVLGFVSAATFRARLAALATALALFAVATEVLQLFGDARFPSAIDLLWDGAGLAAGLSAHAYVRQRRRARARP